MKKRYAISVRGKVHSWSFHFDGKPEHVQEWRDDGLEIDEVCNSIPGWVVNAGLTRAWCFVQDLFYFKNPFTK